MEEIIDITNESHFHDMFSNLAYFRDQNRFCDAIIIVEGREIKAHKCVLAAASTHFEQKISDDIHHSKEGIVLELPYNGSYRITEIIVKYMYTGMMEYCEDDVLPIIECFNELGMECKTIVEKLLNNRNCFQILKMKQEYRFVDIRDVALRYLACYLDELLTDEAFCKLTKEELKELLILSKEIDSEEAVLFLAITEWIKHDTTNRLDSFEEFLDFIPIENFSSEDFNKHVLPNKMLHSSPAGCKWLVAGLTGKNSNISVNISEDHRMFVFSRGPQTHMYKIEEDSGEFHVRRHLQRPEFDSFTMTKYKKFIYAVGGKRHNEIINIGLRYDTELKNWTEFLCPIGKSSCGVWTSKSDKMYVLGGMIGNNSQKTCSYYDYGTGKWITMPDMLKNRWLPGVCGHNSSIYAFGGLPYGDRQSIVERYDSREGEWCRAGFLSFYSGTVAARIGHKINCIKLGTSDLRAYDPRTTNFEIQNDIEGWRCEWMVARDHSLYILDKDGIITLQPPSNEPNQLVHENLGAHSILVY